MSPKEQVKRSMRILVAALAIGAAAIFLLELGHRSGALVSFFAKPINVQGDALAGYVGSFAFLVAFVAVFLQSKELRLQRQELSLTRSEIERQRKAAEDMARSLKAQAKIFELEQAERSQKAADAHVDELLNTLRELFTNAKMVHWTINDPADAAGPYHAFLFPYEPNADGGDARIAEYCAAISACADELGRMLPLVTGRQPISLWPHRLNDVLSDISTHIPTLSAGQRERMARLHVLSAKQALERMAKLPIWEEAET
ncbi:MAG: hypothetical protein AAGA15_13785 [Pseudomonadota bacterium]